MAAFEKKHNVKVKLWRSGADKVLQRTMTEAGAGRFDVDAVFVGSGELEALHREKLLTPIKSANHEQLLPAAMPRHREWAPAYLTVWIQEYNTKAVHKDTLPRTYADLRAPQWKGKLGIEAANDDWFGRLVTEMGERRGSSFSVRSSPRTASRRARGTRSSAISSSRARCRSPSRCTTISRSRRRNPEHRWTGSHSSRSSRAPTGSA